MADTFLHTENPSPIPDRRVHTRRTIRSLAYISIGEDNGGIVLNISETGLALQAVAPLQEGHLAHLRFQLPRSRKRGEASGQIAWTSESGKEAGVQFVGLADDVRKGIGEWVSCDSPWEPSSEDTAAEPETPLHQSAAPPSEIPAPLAEAVAPALETNETSLAGPPDSPIPAPEAAADAISIAAPSEAKPAPTVNLAPVNPAPAARRMWPLSPELAVKAQEQGEHHRIDAGVDRWRWGSIAAVISLLAVLSFAAGLATGRGALSQRLASFGSQAGGTSGAANSAETVQATAAPDLSISSQSSATRENPGVGPAQPPDTGIAPQNLTLRRATTASKGAGDDTPPLSINLPEGPVSASASVAIRSRRSIPVPPESKPQSSARTESLQIGRLISRVQPEYPVDAQEQKVEGSVKLHAIIGQDGTIQSIGDVSGPPLLITSAMNAVRVWRYEPTIYAGQPIETEADITIEFRLPH